MIGESIGRQQSEDVIALSDHCPVVPGVRVLSISVVVDLEPVV